MYNCPSCGTDDVETHNMCATCGADLTLLRRLDEVADVWFNCALEVAEGAPGRALEWLSACCVVRPQDGAARRAQAKVWAQLGRFAEAREALERAAEIEPDAAELESLRASLPQPKPTVSATRQTKPVAAVLHGHRRGARHKPSKKRK